jgi:hypothetical protein
MPPLTDAGSQQIPLCLDGHPGADEVACGAQVKVADGRWSAARVDAERTRSIDVEVLIFNAKYHVDQRALVDHVVEAAAAYQPLLPLETPFPGPNPPQILVMLEQWVFTIFAQVHPPVAKTSNRSQA